MGYATEIATESENIERIAQDDFMQTIAALMPYLMQRRDVARHLSEKPGIGGYEYLQKFNENIKEILCLF